jgi:hypothetical protein
MYYGERKFNSTLKNWQLKKSLRRVEPQKRPHILWFTVMIFVIHIVDSVQVAQKSRWNGGIVTDALWSPPKTPFSWV